MHQIILNRVTSRANDFFQWDSIRNVQLNNSDLDSGSSENTGLLKKMFASRNSVYGIFVANVAKSQHTHFEDKALEDST